MRYDGTPSTAPDRVLHHAIGDDQARRIEDAEPVADRERHARRRSCTISCACAPYAFCDGPPVDSNDRALRRCSPPPSATGPSVECAPTRALQVGLVLAKRQSPTVRGFQRTGRDDEAVVRRAAASAAADTRRLVVVVVRRELVGAVLHRDLEAERRAVGRRRRIEAQRRAERAARRQARRVPAFGRAHAAALERADRRTRARCRRRAPPDRPTSGSSRRARRIVAAEHARRRTRRAGRRCSLPCGVLICARSSTAPSIATTNARAVVELAAHADARVLQLEAVVAADERDVRIVLHRDVLQAQVAERLPRELRRGRPLANAADEVVSATTKSPGKASHVLATVLQTVVAGLLSSQEDW